MSKDQTPATDVRTCPSCGAPLEQEGDMLRCAEHGLFFRYGPRLLVHAPNAAVAETPLLPWQTVQERAVS
jgi:hypothetical protein